MNNSSIKIITFLSLFIAVILIAALIFYIFKKSHSKTGSDYFSKGKAAFYNLDEKFVDSIVDNHNLIESISLLILLEKNLDLIKESNSATPIHGGYLSGFDFLNDDSIDIVQEYMLKASQYSDIISSYGDSLYFSEPDTYNKIRDDNLIMDYNRYFLSPILNSNLNTYVISTKLPLVCDSLYWKSYTDRLVSQINILHEHNKLSILSTDIHNYDKDTSWIVNYEKLIIRLTADGLCGVIAHSEREIDVLLENGFEGLLIYKITHNESISYEIMKKSDLFMFGSNDYDSFISFRESLIKQLKPSDIRKRLKKYLYAVLWTMQPRPTTDVYMVQKIKHRDLYERIFSELTLLLLKNDNDLIPISNINSKIHILNLTKTDILDFKETISFYNENYSYSKINIQNKPRIIIPDKTELLIILSDSSLVGFTSYLNNQLKKHTETVLVHFGSVYQDLLALEANSVIIANNLHDYNQTYSAQLVFGGVAASGRIAYHLNDSISYNYGLKTLKTRLKYSIPEDAGLCRESLTKIDSIVNAAITSTTFPGCQVFVAKNGTVVYNKSFGYHDYSRRKPVRNSDLYDIASITKIAATSLAVMKLTEEKKLDLNEKTGKYFKDTYIDYGNIPADTIISFDTISIFGKSKTQLQEMFKDINDTVHLNDTLVIVQNIVFLRATPRYNIFQVPVRRLLMHQSGISPSLPILPYLFYRKTYTDLANQYILDKDTINNSALVNNTFLDTLLGFDNQIDMLFPELKDLSSIEIDQLAFNYFFSRRRIKDSADIQITDKMYLRNHFGDSLYKNIKRLKIYSRAVTEYSCMNMILMQMIVDSINKKDIDRYLKEEFYSDLGMLRTSYNPLKYFSRDNIIPTEDDRLWRKQLIHGTVHDPSAAILGGISGNAGLFSTASDLGILGQLWLNRGIYGGKRYLNPLTVDYFTGDQPENYRGLGFDRAKKNGVHAISASPSTYGHLGFTGCCMWVDPENEIVFVFLSNRIHPRSSNFKLISNKVRQRIHQAVYDAVIE